MAKAKKKPPAKAEGRDAIGRRLSARRANGTVDKHAPTDQSRAVVTALVASLAGHEFIAKHLKISRETLRKYYAHELETALEAANVQVVRNLHNLTKKNTGAAVFWLANRKKGEWEHVQRNVHDAGKGFDLEAIIKGSMGKGGKDAGGKKA